MITLRRFLAQVPQVNLAIVVAGGQLVDVR